MRLLCRRFDEVDQRVENTREDQLINRTGYIAAARQAET